MDDTSYEYKWKNIIMDDGRVHPLAKTIPSLVNNLWRNIVMDDWNLDVEALDKWYSLQHCKSIIPPRNYKGMITNVGLTCSVVDNTPQFTTSIERDNWNWWHNYHI